MTPAAVAARALPVIVALTVLWSAPARADPCKGRLPVKGAEFSGVARYVGDGDGLCVGPAGAPGEWIEIRLGDFYAPELSERGGREAKQRLERLVLGRVVTCRSGRRSYDRIIGYCTLRGEPLGRLLMRGGGVQGGRGWRANR